MLTARGIIIRRTEADRLVVGARQTRNYRLQYDLCDCRGKVVQKNVYVWESPYLSTALLIREVIKYDGIQRVVELYEEANKAYKAQTAKFKRSEEAMLNDLLEEEIVVVED